MTLRTMKLATLPLSSSSLSSSSSSSHTVLSSMSSNASSVVVGFAQKQRHQGRQHIRFFGTGARGARGLGWYQKYREGRGGRHLQGPQFDRESRDVLAEMNDTIFRMGSMWYTIRLCEMASNSSSTTANDSDAAVTTDTTTSDNDALTKEDATNDNPMTFHDLHLELATGAMPLTTTNFALLAPQYKDTIVHRIEKKVGLCLGDVKMNLGRSGYCHESLSSTGKLPTTEPLVLSHLAGIVTMVSSGVDKVDSRFMLCTADSYQLDGRFVAFGRLSPASLAVCQEIEKSHYTTRGLPNVEIKVVSCEPLVENIASAVVSEVSDDQSA